MEKKSKLNSSNKDSLNNKIEESISGAKDFLLKEKEYEEYLKRIEKLSRGAYNV